MIRVVEAFSGIGSQAKALSRIGIDYDIVSTIEWDINAIYAYDIIHNGVQDLRKYDGVTKNVLVEELMKYTLSGDGKKPITKTSLKSMSIEALKRILYAINRTKNLVSITDVKGEDLPDEVDLFTYSFPCQDLSICGAWHGNTSGIDRNAHNRSGMLWEVERILKEYVLLNKPLPKFLLMENVSNILSNTHRHNFQEWKDYLEEVGYFNKVYTLDASNFGIPQRRKRTYMLSVLCNNERQVEQVRGFLEENDLEQIQVKREEIFPLQKFLRMDYTIPKYRNEAEISTPNYTPSRLKIYKDNIKLFDGNDIKYNVVKTITTKQDRNPNSGIIVYKSIYKNKSPYRNLTPRECFMLMGFDEFDFQNLIDNNFEIRNNKYFLSREKLIKMAGNSIVVNVLEKIFQQIEYLNKSVF